MTIRTYCKSQKDTNSSESAYNLIRILPQQHNELKERYAVIKKGLQVSSKERKEIKQVTSVQTECLLWHQVRQQRIIKV